MLQYTAGGYVTYTVMFPPQRLMEDVPDATVEISLSFAICSCHFNLSFDSVSIVSFQSFCP